MRSELTIEPYESGLRVRVRAPMDLWRIVLLVPIGALFLYLIPRHSDFSGWILKLLLALIVLSLLRELVSAARGTEVELVIRDLDFVSRGHAPGGYRPCQVSRDDLLRLEFRKSSGGGEEQEYPCGLYVEYDSDSAWETAVCVLPGIDAQQTKQVIDAIRSRFPELDRITSPRPSKSGLISLNLNR